MNSVTKIAWCCIALAFLFLGGCESGTKKFVPKDTEANADSDQLLGDEDGLLGDEDGVVTDDWIDEDPGDGDAIKDGDSVKDDAAPLDGDSAAPDEDVVPETCGNAQVDEGEVCDGNLIDCVEIDDKLYSGGKASCLDTCLGWDTITCDEIPHECGNGIVEGPEVCDTELLTDCVAIDPEKYSAGKAYCLEDCSAYDTITCEEIVVDEDTVTDDAVVADDTTVADEDIVVVDDTVIIDEDIVDVDTLDIDTVDIDIIDEDIVDIDTVDIDYFEQDILPDVDVPAPCGSVRLDGSTGYIEVAHNALLNLSGNWTIEAWVNQDTEADQSPILRKGNTLTYPAYYLYGTYNQIFTTEAPYGGYYYDTATSAAADGGSTPSTGTWYHVAFVKNGSTITTFIDGVPGTSATDANNSYANSESLFFGSRRSSTPSYFDGLIDEIRISSVARYTTTFTPQERLTNEANTIGLWHFEEGVNNIATNSAGATLDGLLVGGVTWESTCAAEGPIVTPDDDVMPDEDTAGTVIDTVGSTEPMTGGTSRMRGNFYSCDTDRTLTEIEIYLTYTGTPTVYFEVYESTALNGTYYPIESVTVTSSMSGGAFYSSGPIDVALYAGNYYYIGARWGSSYSMGYAADTAAAVGDYPTAFGTWEMGMLEDGVTSAPASFLYDDVMYDYAYYQRLTTE